MEDHDYESKKKKTPRSKTQAHVKHTHNDNPEMIQQKKLNPLQTKIQNTTKKLTVGLISSNPKAQNKSPLKTPSWCLPSNPISSKPN